MEKSVIKIVRKVKTTNTIINIPKINFENEDNFNDEFDFSDGEHGMTVNGNYFSFEINDLPHCCGVFEIGSINIHKDFPEKYISDALSRMVETATNAMNDRCKTIIINTNGQYDCIKMEKVLAKHKYFQLVKTFKNSNGGNTIKMWISKN